MAFPLALPSIVIAALIVFLIGYIEFAISWLFIESGENVTLVVVVSGLLSSAWNKFSGLALMMSLPVVLLIFFLRRYPLRGLPISATDT